MIFWHIIEAGSISTTCCWKCWRYWIIYCFSLHHPKTFWIVWHISVFHMETSWWQSCQLLSLRFSRTDWAFLRESCSLYTHIHTHTPNSSLSNVPCFCTISYTGFVISHLERHDSSNLVYCNEDFKYTEIYFILRKSSKKRNHLIQPLNTETSQILSQK